MVRPAGLEPTQNLGPRPSALPTELRAHSGIFVSLLYENFSYIKFYCVNFLKSTNILTIMEYYNNLTILFFYLKSVRNIF